MAGRDAFGNEVGADVKRGWHRVMAALGETSKPVWATSDLSKPDGEHVVELLAHAGIKAELCLYTEEAPTNLMGGGSNWGRGPRDLIHYRVCVHNEDLKHALQIIDAQNATDLADVPSDEELARLSEQAYEDATGQKPPGFDD